MKIITFTVPCYNSEAYMEHCIETLLPGGEDVEIILVDDGSSDGTAIIADNYASKYPSIVKAIHQENGGHGEAVNTGIKNASGLYFKVVDSDDWLDVPGMLKVISVLKELHEQGKVLDMMICNYVYEHSVDNTSHVVRYKNVMPENRVFGWSDVGKFKMSQYILMHSVIYNTELLHECGLVLPKHTFYVDNLFVYQPLPYIKTIYYMNIDLYRYFIGREDQSVNEKIMIKRIDQQIRVTKLMIDFYCTIGTIPNKRLDDYMKNYLSMMMTISSVLLVVSGTEENLQKKKELWLYLKNVDEKVYLRMRYRLFGIVSNLWGNIGRKITKYAYYLTSRKYKFN
ncbi:glycosyltransferase family 2 protein [Clostridium drakei]|uniref:Glycosyl transferase n=1 Tax=Clostridium drakei TaxID=332101 RepID=A0A2U8DNF9_9CLOT|nr:glycosyltransferase family A protein [Clostridium drakei]AWI04286.1 glycosyl transferase [Clostridium drakei]